MNSTMHEVINFVITLLVAVSVISVIVLVNHATKEDRMKDLKS
ncbi:hypothetical protein C8P68_1101 [Mucilaginibacter yixingensis]|uniref:Uncharacterized protein n=1 Tax=Mucilaginibacter yixingensis TaxID=1295612 RepID=A0A2T5J573_9SPHI|nr:hypothetical protein [Mucilaginibacter yixingensis]PTQ92870.1 hypothetical protein C8P68_1101 [Mucilaginibacter yixingensis]